MFLECCKYELGKDKDSTSPLNYDHCYVGYCICIARGQFLAQFLGLIKAGIPADKPLYKRISLTSRYDAKHSVLKYKTEWKYTDPRHMEAGVGEK